MAKDEVSSVTKQEPERSDKGKLINWGRRWMNGIKERKLSEPYENGAQTA